MATPVATFANFDAGSVVLTAGKRPDFSTAEFLYAGLGLRPGP